METYKCKTCGAEWEKPSGKASYIAHCAQCAKKAKALGVDVLPKGAVSCKGAITQPTDEDLKAVEELMAAYNREQERDEMVKSDTMTPQREALIKQAQTQCTCRGDFEANKDTLCRKYSRCSDCWADFNK